MNEFEYRSFMQKELMYFGYNLTHIGKAITSCSNIKDCIEYIKELEQDEKAKSKPIEKIETLFVRSGNSNMEAIGELAKKINELIDKVNSLSKE